MAEPVAAFGPPGSTGELNVSAIVAPIQQGFQLSRLGGPQAAAERFLSTTVAPPGSGLETDLISATERWKCSLTSSFLKSPHPTESLKAMPDPQSLGLQAFGRHEMCAAPERQSPVSPLNGAWACRMDAAGQLYYSLEYTVQRPEKFFRHNISVYAARCAHVALPLAALYACQTCLGSPLLIY